MPDPIKLLPSEIWVHVLSYLKPSHWLRLSSVSKGHKKTIEAQRMHALMWPEILPKKELPVMRTDQGRNIDLVLVGRLKDIGKESKKPSILLGTTPVHNRPSDWREFTSIITDKAKQQKHGEQEWVDFPKFSLNTGAVFGCQNFIRLPTEDVDDWLKGDIYALRYNQPRLIPVEVRLDRAFCNFGMELIIEFEDVYIVLYNHEREYDDLGKI